MAGRATAAIPSHERVLREQLLAGASVEKAAQVAGVSARTAYRWAKTHGLELAAEVLRASGVARFLGRPQARGRVS